MVHTLICSQNVTGTKNSIMISGQLDFIMDASECIYADCHKILYCHASARRHSYKCVQSLCLDCTQISQQRAQKIICGAAQCLIKRIRNVSKGQHLLNQITGIIFAMSDLIQETLSINNDLLNDKKRFPIFMSYSTWKYARNLPKN